MSEPGIGLLAHGAKVLERLDQHPGGPELLELAKGRDDMELVGGAVRDLLLDRTPRELDVVVAHDAPALAEALAGRIGAEATVHERFGTAVVEHGEARIDFATRREESYPAPGALPEVRPGTPRRRICAVATSRSMPSLWHSTGPIQVTCAPHRMRLKICVSDACACCTTGASRMTQRACCVWLATTQGWVLRLSSTRRSWRGRR